MNARKLLSAAKAVEAAYIEDVFSTYLYTGNGSTQTITNGIDLSGKGGLVWVKRRDATIAHGLWDTARGAGTGTSNATNKALASNLTDAQGLGTTYPGENLDYVNAFNANGFSLTTAAGGRNLANGSGGTYASWTFRKQAKFFDVVTYTGNGGTKTVSHGLGSTPGCIIVKRTDTTGDWPVYHRSVTANCGFLNTTNSFASAQRFSSVTSTDFTINVSTADVNANGGTYVAYLFAHDAGGFGASGSDNVISCGSYTGNGVTGLAVTLGYEPQWVMVKCSSDAQADGWIMVDNMRGMDNSANAWLKANTSGAETAESPRIVPTATGFTLSSNAAVNTNAATYIYIAIRRGPMKTPTTGTSVFYPLTRTGDATAQVVTGGSFPTDLAIYQNRPQSLDVGHYFQDRLRGGLTLTTNTTGAEYSYTQAPKFDVQSGVSLSGGNYTPNFSTTYVYYYLGRAPGFFDVVCYTGTGVSRDVNHSLGVVPELWIVKQRANTTGSWVVGSTVFGSQTGDYAELNNSGAVTVSGLSIWKTPTTTTIGIGTFVQNSDSFNATSKTYVAYLFATCPGVSKVGTYTGTGNTLQIDCGFTGGARFVLIKRTDSTGDWYVWDSARGIVAGNDPYLLLNSTAAEVTTTDWVDTYSAGFELSNVGGNNANINTATYIFLAIA